jgi:diguanylate cyclase (GGDEF)-like protein
VTVGPDDGAGPLAWVLERTWATVIVAVAASAAVTAALSWALSGQLPGVVGLTISTVAAAMLSGVASLQRNRHVRALEGVQRQLRDRVREVEALRDELRALAVRDPLTDAYNRRILDEVAPPFFAAATRGHGPVALVLLDLDRFKEVNDADGHAAGDALLVALARHLQGGVRTDDVVVRFGGEEFALMMPGLDAAGAGARIDALRRRWRAEGARATFSAGVAAAPADGVDLDALLRVADDALYEAKRAGRDRVWADGAALPSAADEAA